MPRNYTVDRKGQKISTWSIPEKLIKQFNLKEHEKVTLYFGSAKTSVQVIQQKKAPVSDINMMGMSNSVVTKLHIPDHVSLKIKQTGQKSFRLGPVIGILTFSGHIPNRLRVYKGYATRNVNNGLLYVFCGRGIDPQNQLITGYYYDIVKKKWKPGVFPYPDTVFDRCYPNAYRSHNLLEKEIGLGKIFNKKSMIDKVDFATTLNDDPDLKNHIAETRLLHSETDLQYLLDKSESVFLKPTNAMKGIGIVVASKAADGWLECLYTVKGENFTKHISSPGEIHDVLKAACGRERPYIVQQAIQRMEYKGGPFSIRTWAMKNGKGKWAVPGMFAKGSFGASFLTNFTAGAKLIPLQELYNDILPRLSMTQDQFYKLVEHLTLKTAKVLDEKYGPLGELGFDIVFDNNGKPWIIEANGNPGSIPIFMQTDYPAWRHLVYQYPLAYATHLAGFKITKHELQAQQL